MAAIKLSDEQISRIKDAMRAINDLLPDIDKAKKCGIDCSEHLEDARRQLAYYTSLLQEFGGS